MFEQPGLLDGMSTEVSVCVPTAAAPFFPLVTADTHKSPAHDRVAAAGSPRGLFLFYFQETL